MNGVITPIRKRNIRGSKVTGGRNMFVEIGDGRSPWARRWNDLIFAHISDLGGSETLSEAQISLCRRAATMECELEAMEGRMSAGEPIDTGVYGRLAIRLCRLLELVGIKPPQARPIDPLSELAKALEAYPSKPIDDDGDDDGNEPLPSEAKVDPDPAASSADMPTGIIPKNRPE
jgi:hypothetical protein